MRTGNAIDRVETDKRHKLLIPTINDSALDFGKLFNLFAAVRSLSHTEVVFDFSQCSFLRPNAVVLLGGMCKWIEYCGGKYTFDFESFTNNTLMRYLVNHSLFDFLFPQNYSSLFPDIGTDTTIPFREDKNKDKDEILRYLQERWLQKGWINISDKLVLKIISNVWEIYENAFEHGHSPIGVFTSGQYYPKLKEIQLCTIDFGVSIPYNVRKFLSDSSKEAKECLRWAFSPGNTTRLGTITGGCGLKILKEFVRLNSGRLEVYSGNAYGVIDQGREDYENKKYTPFDGTLVSIKLKCDECLYLLSSEMSRSTAFLEE